MTVRAFIQMAMGSGKTLLAITRVYRLIKFGGEQVHTDFVRDDTSRFDRSEMSVEVTTRSRIVDDETYSAPPVLYHYTSAEATRAIVCSSHPSANNGPTLWATSVELMNDASELDLGFRAFHDALDERARVVPVQLGETLRQFGAYVGKSLLTSDPGSGARNTVCAFSLSEDGDQLGQWRAYCPRNGGYAIGFRSEALLASGFTLRKCRYLHAEHLELFSRLAVDTAAEFAANEVNIIDMVWARLLALAPCVKHEAFAHEKEWRLITGKTYMHALSIRASGSLLLPFREITLRDHGPNAIAEIVIGPQPYQDLAESGLQALFEQLFGTRWQVRRSTVPYRVLV